MIAQDRWACRLQAVLDRLLNEMRLTKDKTYCLVWKCWFSMYMRHVIEVGLNSSQRAKCDAALPL